MIVFIYSNIPGTISCMRSTFSKSEKRLFNECKDIYSFETRTIFLIWKKALKVQSLKALKKYIKKRLNLPNNAGLPVLSLSYILHLHIYLKAIIGSTFLICILIY